MFLRLCFKCVSFTLEIRRFLSFPKCLCRADNMWLSMNGWIHQTGLPSGPQSRNRWLEKQSERLHLTDCFSLSPHENPKDGDKLKSRETTEAKCSMSLLTLWIDRQPLSWVSRCRCGFVAFSGENCAAFFEQVEQAGEQRWWTADIKCAWKVAQCTPKRPTTEGRYFHPWDMQPW